ncbi:uncharacterized protein LOC113498714 [Trichoplusia ni]|uniref:Uncharacterized protein LOC113498714 n=1 Tax=Trichoplusia ni TaxID=7111 RepID=A0A7E5W2V8_TRINI|nr:uncharacterized protein LOC113498714 [Trichoplusia ni]
MSEQDNFIIVQYGVVSFGSARHSEHECRLPNGNDQLTARRLRRFTKCTFKNIKMVQCAIKGCSSRSDVHTALDHQFTFHRLPKFRKHDTELTPFIKSGITDSTRICSKHFTDKNFYHTSTGKRRLKRDAIPDIHLDLNEGRPAPPKLLKRKSVPNPNMTTDTMVSEPSIVRSDSTFQSTFQIYTQKRTKFASDQNSNEESVEGELNNEDMAYDEDLANEQTERESEFRFEDVEEELDNEEMNETNADIGMDDESIHFNDTVSEMEQIHEETPLERELKEEVKKLKLLCNKRLQVIKSLRLQNTLLAKKVASLEESLRPDNEEL